MKQKKEQKAWQQGKLDKLCGVYALVNAYRLLVPSDRAQYNSDWQLFKASVEWLDSQELLFDAVTSGLKVEHLLGMIDGVFKPAFRFIDVVQLWEKKRRLGKNGLNQILEYVAPPSSTVLACYYDPTDREEHWTVFQKVGKKKIYLYDSDGNLTKDWPLNFTSKGLHYNPRNLLIFCKIKNGNGK